MSEEAKTQELESEKDLKTTEILFYCKFCKELIEDPKKIGNRYVYKCPKCGKDRVAFGSKSSIESYFHI